MSGSPTDSSPPNSYFPQRRRSSVRATISQYRLVIQDKVDFKLIAKHITEERILSRDQENRLWQSYVPEEERLGQMLEFISQKGENGLRQFIRCLHISGESAQHQGHTELAEILERQL